MHKAVKLVKALESRAYEDPWGFGITLVIRRLGYPSYQDTRDKFLEQIAEELGKVALVDSILGAVDFQCAPNGAEADGARRDRISRQAMLTTEDLFRKRLDRDPVASERKESQQVAMLVAGWTSEAEWVGNDHEATPENVYKELLGADGQGANWLPAFTDPDGEQCEDPRTVAEVVQAPGAVAVAANVAAPPPASGPLPEGYQEWEFGGRPMPAAWKAFILDRAAKVQTDYDKGLGVVEKNSGGG